MSDSPQDSTQYAHDPDSQHQMTVMEFWEQGYLQELNRQFLHPLGLALAIQRSGDPESDNPEMEWIFSPVIWDYRDDPEGMNFAPRTTQDPNFVRKARQIEALQSVFAQHRINTLGYVIQPVPDMTEDPA